MQTETAVPFKPAVARQIRPLENAGWLRFVEEHPRSSVFHTPAWLETLRRTYRYEPLAFTTSPASEKLQNAIVLCRVDSWFTGRRLVSLPFSDHCDALVDHGGELAILISALQSEMSRNGLNYVELRPTRALGALSGPHSTCTYYRHQIDLDQDLDTLFHRCHKSSTQRKIVRAKREGLTLEEGRSAELLDSFYRLLLLTRRRHSVPPQPKRWFQNLVACFGETLTIRVAQKDGQAIAAILTLRFKDTLVYKYGCSDARFHPLGGMHMLLWKAIADAKQERLRVFDLGRSDWRDEGLISFKDRWGASRSVLTYSQLSASGRARGVFRSAGTNWKDRIAKNIFAHLPDRVLGAAGELLYKHVG